MKNLKKKIGGGNGFTLVEMLIVVAIIAILIAISIPLVNNALERAKHATDAANERAAKAEIMIDYLAEGKVVADKVYTYDAKTGTVTETPSTTPVPYGQHKTHKDKFITGSISADGVVTMGWTNNVSTSPSPAANGGLCSEKDVNGHS